MNFPALEDRLDSTVFEGVGRKEHERDVNTFVLVPLSLRPPRMFGVSARPLWN